MLVADPSGAAAAPQPDADGGGLGRVQEAGRTDDHRQASIVTEGYFVKNESPSLWVEGFTPLLPGFPAK